MLLAVTVTIILTTVGWPSSALMSEIVSRMCERSRKHLSEKRESEISLKAEPYKTFVEVDRRSDKKNERLKNLKKLRRQVSKAADLLNRYESVRRQVEFMLTDSAEHCKVHKSCPSPSCIISTRPEQIKETSPETNGGVACRMCSALDGIGTQSASGFGSAEVVLEMAVELTATSELLKQIIERAEESLRQPKSSGPLVEFKRKPKPQALKSTGADIGGLSGFRDPRTLEPTNRVNKIFSARLQYFSEAVRKLKRTRVEVPLPQFCNYRRSYKPTDTETELLNPRQQLGLKNVKKPERTRAAAETQFFCAESEWSKHDYSLEFPNVRKLEQTRVEERHFFCVHTGWLINHDYIKLKQNSAENERLTAQKHNVESEPSSGLSIHFILFIFSFLCFFYFSL